MGEPEREVDGPECATEAQNITNEPKLRDDVLNTENGVHVEVTADSGSDSDLTRGWSCQLLGWSGQSTSSVVSSPVAAWDRPTGGRTGDQEC